MASEEQLMDRIVDATPTKTAATPGAGVTPSAADTPNIPEMNRSSSWMEGSASPTQKLTHSYDELLNTFGTNTQGAQDLDPVIMAQDVDILKGRLRSMGKGLLDPRSKLMQYW